MTQPDSHTPHPIVELRALHKAYVDGDLNVSVLRGIDLSILPGEIVALTGSSGAGKSTLLNILGCLDRPSHGHYLLGGRDVSQLSREEQAWVRLHYLGFIFQSFHLIGHASVLENVALPLYYAGVGRKERNLRAMALIERVGLADRIDHRPNQLSGGQRQRAAIARALACKPKLLLADEPTGALDSRTSEEVLGLLRELHRETGLTIVMVTHEEHVAAIAGRRIAMRDGRIVEETRA